MKSEQESKFRRPFKDLLKELKTLADGLEKSEFKNRKLLKAVSENHRLGAQNLLHYLALRRQSLEDLQLRLANLGLSSLGRSEAHVLHTIHKVIERLNGNPNLHNHYELDASNARQRLKQNTVALFGPLPQNIPHHIIITSPDVTTVTADWLERMLNRGMTCLRINCAHGTEEEWHTIIELLRRTSTRIGKPCSVMVDLAGPKIRTEVSCFGGDIQIWKPQKSLLGEVINPVLVLMTTSTLGPSLLSRPEEILIMSKESVALLEEGDQVELEDVRGKIRKIRILKRENGIVLGELNKKCYLRCGIEIVLKRRGKLLFKEKLFKVINKEPFVQVHQGQSLILEEKRANRQPNLKRSTHRKTNSLEPRVTCTIAGAFRKVEVGHRVLFDDGKVEAVVEEKTKNQLHLRVLRTPKEHFKLRNQKSINFPDSAIDIRGLTKDDRKHLEFVFDKTDIVGLSFVNDLNDVKELLRCIHQLKKKRHKNRKSTKKAEKDLGIVLKIETQSGFKNLPSILFELLKHRRVGIMIARGDLAVEVGFERLAEVQEEILWLCEASHIPVIWATQVLENLAKTGLPSRAEITDAAMSGRAEAIMLNKGPYIDKAIESLVDILTRMQTHQNKKKSLLKALRVSSAPLMSDFSAK